jgi:hypothetical protein
VQPSLEKSELGFSDNYNMKKHLYDFENVNPELINILRRAAYSAKDSQHETFETYTQASRIE